MAARRWRPSVLSRPARAIRDKRVKHLHSETLTLRAEGRYEEARTAALDSLALFDSHPGNVVLGATLAATLGLIELDLGNHRAGEAAYRHALKMLEGPLADHQAAEQRIGAMAGVANSLRLQGRYDEAEGAFVEAFKAAEADLGAHDPQIPAILNNWAIVYKYNGRFDEAERLYRRALSIRERIYGPEHYEVAVTLNNLAAIAQRRAELSEAEALYRRATAIKERLLGRDHPELATTLNNLATVLRKQQRYQEAEALYVRCLRIWESTLDAHHPSLLACLENYAVLLRDQGRQSEAHQMEMRAAR